MVCIKCVGFLLSDAHVIKSSLQLNHRLTPWTDIQYVLFVHTCYYLTQYSIAIVCIVRHLKLFWHSNFSVQHPPLQPWSDKAPQTLRSVGEVQHATSSLLEAQRPLPGGCMALGVPWRGQKRRGARSDWQERWSSGGCRCVQTICGGSVGGVSPVNRVFSLLRLLCLPITDLCTAIFSSCCTLKDVRAEAGTDRVANTSKRL